LAYYLLIFSIQISKDKSPLPSRGRAREGVGKLKPFYSLSLLGREVLGVNTFGTINNNDIETFFLI
jgi:hypothetical protein